MQNSRLHLSFAVLAIFTLPFGCSSDSDGDEGNTAGASGSAAAAGAAGAPLSGSAGSSGEGARPSGAVVTCYGAGCPNGECDDDLFFADVACSAVYGAPLGPTSPLCGNGGEYCLSMADFTDWAVRCAGTQATVQQCSVSCASAGTAVTCE